MAEASARRFDVIVVSYNSAEHLRKCVESLSASGRTRVIVVDNASTDGSLASIEDLPVTRVVQSTNSGFAHGCNAGWRLGDAPHVLFLNPDSELSLAALDLLGDTLAQDESLGIVGPQIRNGDGSLALSIHRFPRLRSTYSEALYLHHLAPGRSWASESVQDIEPYGRAGDVEWLSGACLLVRRDLLELIGGFDEDFFMYSEDMQLCRKARAAGFRVRYEPAAVAVHVGGASAPRSSLLPVLANSRMLYSAKNDSPASMLAHRIGFALEALTHLVTARNSGTRRGYADSLRAILAGPRPAWRPGPPGA